MFRKFAISAAAIVTFLGFVGTQAQAQVKRSSVYPEEYQRTAMEAVVRITATDGDKAWQGSGVCIGYSSENGTALILTAAHVVRGATRVDFEVFTSDSLPNAARRYKSPVAKWWSSRDDDGAIIVAKIWVPRTAKLAEDPESVREGDILLSLGCGIGFPPAADIGELSGYYEGDYVVDQGSVGGRSGGPLFSTKGLIGILSRGRNDETIYVSLAKIHRFINRVAEQVRAKQ